MQQSSAVTRYLIFFQYLGTKYSGVMKAPAHQPLQGVQNHLENAVRKLKPVNEVSVSISSRTDTGVHALCNSAHLDIQRRGDKPPFTEQVLTDALNFLLKPEPIRAPVEIGLLLVEEVEEGGECTDRERRGKETRWKGSKARSIGAGFKLFCYGVDSKRNGVGVVLKEEFVRNVLEVKRVSDRVMSLKLEIEGVMLNVVSGYAPQVMGKFGVKERNLEGQMVVDFAKRMDMAVVNIYFQKREEHRVTYKSGGRRTQVVLPDDWETTAEVIRETGRKVLGVSSGRRKEDKETWWRNEEVQDSIQRKRLAKKKWDMDRTEENRQEYKELQRRVKKEVSKAKQKAYDELYTRLDTREGEKDLYRLARQRDRDGKDVQQVRVIKDKDGRVLTSEESVQRRWKEYFEELMNEENERERRVEGVNSVEQKVDKIRKDEVRKALKRMKSGKAVGPDDIPVEVWKCLGEAAVEFLTSLFNRVLENLEKAYDRVPREELWYCMRKSGIAEKYVRVVQDMYERSRTVVRCAVVMDQLSEEVRQESPWTMMFADDIVICSESREQVEENLERWRFALERRGMKVSRSKTEYMCVNEREGSGTVRLQGEEVKKVQEFKYLGQQSRVMESVGKRITRVYCVQKDFHARYRAISRTYVYRLATGICRHTELPITEKDLCWTLENMELNVDAMREAGAMFQGTHDFSTFRALSSDAPFKNPLKTMELVQVDPGLSFSQRHFHRDIQFWELTFKSRSFLYKQVRRMVGALVAVGRGKLSIRQVQDLLDSRDSMAYPQHMAAPPYGLFLINVEYSDSDLKPSIEDTDCL
ncbi:hypothetical protein QTP86_027069 [Hemibagrus guttatus]|nr:hypothetical protein QTP86_027069 [Hemibagrus guttatus]